MIHIRCNECGYQHPILQKRTRSAPFKKIDGVIIKGRKTEYYIDIPDTEEWPCPKCGRILIRRKETREQRRERMKLHERRYGEIRELREKFKEELKAQRKTPCKRKTFNTIIYSKTV